MRLTRRERLEIGALALIACLVAVSAVAGGRFDIVLSPRPVMLSDQHCTARPETSSLVCRAEGQWTPTPQGEWLLRPGTTGTVLARVDLDPNLRHSAFPFWGPEERDGRVLLALYGDPAAGVQAALQVSRDGRQFQPLPMQVSFNGARLDLTPYVEGATALWVRLDARMPADEPSRPARLARLRILTQKTPLPVPNVASAAMLILVPLLAYRVRSLSRSKGALLYGLAVLAGMALLSETIVRSWTMAEDPLRWWELVTDGRDRDVYLLVPYLVLLSLLGWHCRIWRAGLPGQWWWSGFALGGILIWGLSRRLVAFAQATDLKLDPDIIAYLHIARTMASPYATDFREPLWVWVLKGWLGLTGWGAGQVRLLTILVSLLLVVMAYKFFRDYTGRPLIGSLVALLLATNPHLIRLSVRGLREEAYAAAILAVVYCVFAPESKLPLRAQAAGLAVAGAAVELLRFNSYVILLPLFLWWGWRRASSRWAYAVLPIVFIVAAALPHAVHNYKTFGDPLYSVNIHFAWWRNYELVVKKGLSCEGCPSAEQFFVTPYAGPPITAFGYIFGLRSLPDMIDDTVEGYRNMFLSRTDWFEAETGTKSSWGLYGFLLGLGVVLIAPYREMVPLALLLTNVAPFMLMHDADIRLAAHIAPFASFFLAYGLWWLCAQVAALAGAVAGERSPMAVARQLQARLLWRKLREAG